jgi:hypothetical protein
MSDPRNFECPWTEGPCTEEQCNYKATGYCLRGEREDLALRRAEREKERDRRRTTDQLAEAKRLREHRKERRIELERKRRGLGHLSF